MKRSNTLAPSKAGRLWRMLLTVVGSASLAAGADWPQFMGLNLDKGGSILTAEGLIYVMDGRTRELYIVQPSPEGFKSLGKAKLLGGKEIWGPRRWREGSWRFATKAR
jgi:hypothetical protein